MLNVENRTVFIKDNRVDLRLGNRAPGWIFRSNDDTNRESRRTPAALSLRSVP